jgi:hypothetical protein
MSSDQLRKGAEFFTINDIESVRDLRPETLDAEGRLRVLPAAFWAGTTRDERALFGSRTGLYSFPTEELVARLKEIINGRRTIEIGAGHGVLAEALGIPATDSFQQRMRHYAKLYAAQGLVTVPYGPAVTPMPADQAVRVYEPDVVIACWVTHKYDPAQPARKGNEVGVDELDILQHCAEYVFVGNEGVHADKPLWELQKHTIEFPAYVVSRAANGSRDFIAVVQGFRA